MIFSGNRNDGLRQGGSWLTPLAGEETDSVLEKCSLAISTLSQRRAHEGLDVLPSGLLPPLTADIKLAELFDADYRLDARVCAEAWAPG